MPILEQFYQMIKNTIMTILINNGQLQDAMVISVFICVS